MQIKTIALSPIPRQLLHDLHQLDLAKTIVSTDLSNTLRSYGQPPQLFEEGFPTQHQQMTANIINGSKLFILNTGDAPGSVTEAFLKPMQRFSLKPFIVAPQAGFRLFWYRQGQLEEPALFTSPEIDHRSRDIIYAETEALLTQLNPNFKLGNRTSMNTGRVEIAAELDCTSDHIIFENTEGKIALTFLAKTGPKSESMGVALIRRLIDRLRYRLNPDPPLFLEEGQYFTDIIPSNKGLAMKRTLDLLKLDLRGLSFLTIGDGGNDESMYVSANELATQHDLTAVNVCVGFESMAIAQRKAVPNLHWIPGHNSATFRIFSELIKP